MQDAQSPLTIPEIFARVDVGVMPNENKTGFEWFIHTINRFPNVSWFTEAAPVQQEEVAGLYGLELCRYAKQQWESRVPP